MKVKINLIPSLAEVLFVTIFIYLPLSDATGLLDDGDTGYHIRAGEFILDTLSIPSHDMFSFLSPPLPWTAHEWLSEVIMALLHRSFGLTGVVLFFCFLIAWVSALLFKMVRRHNGNIITAFIIVLLATVSSGLHWLARPHIFSLLLLLVWYYVLEIYQYKDKNYLYLLPPVMLLWVNLHGGYVLGLVLIAIYLFGNILSYMNPSGKEKERFSKKSKNLSLVMLACLFISLINPYGYHILLFPLELTSNQYLMDIVNEFLSPDFHKVTPFRYMLFLMIAAFAASRASLNIIEIILVLLFTHMALYSQRHIPLFAIIVAPVITRQIDLIINRENGRFITFFRKRSEGIASTDASSGGYFWPIAAVLLVILSFSIGEAEYKFSKKIKPVDAVEFLKREKLPGNMFNNDEFGDYIIYDAWPEYKVFIDGRLDMYGPKRLSEYLKVTGIRSGWNEVLQKYEINWIIYNANSTLSEFLLQRSDWKLIYADAVANIFIRNTAENKELIEKYKNVRPDAEGKATTP